MAITLTDLPLPWQVTCTLNDFGVDQTGKNGAPQLRGPRNGSRWSVKFSALPSLSFACGRVLLAARIAARTQGSTVICPWPQQAFGAAIGAPAVNGAGQVGSALVVNGLTANVEIPAGVFFSVAGSGRNYLYALAASVTADGGGNASLPLAPWLRQAPDNAASLAFAAPQVEGFINGTSEAWSVSMNAWVGLPEFTIDELQ